MSRYRVLVLLALLSGCAARSFVIAPACEPNQRLAVVAQSVPTASAVPCVAQMPAGWSAGGVVVRSGRTTFWLNSDRAGDGAVQVRLSERCDAPLPPGHPVGERLADRSIVADRVHIRWTHRLERGCVTTRLNLPRSGASALEAEAAGAISFYERDQLRADIHTRSGVDIGPAAD